MPAERYYIHDSFDSSLNLTENEFHHLVRVMRTREGEQVELVNGAGKLAHATVKKIGKDFATLDIDHVIVEAPSRVKTILAQAIVKPNRLDFILEKGTELGVDEFWLFPGQLSVKSDFSSNQIERMKTLTIAAMKQCGRLFLPNIVMKPSIEEWTPLTATTFFGDVQEEAVPFLKAWQEETIYSPIVFVTGPESGFTDREVILLKEKGALGVKLHSNVLRTETASIMAVSLIQHSLLNRNY